jgi:hypothetical protein
MAYDSMSDRTVSVVIPWRDRPELELTLAKNVQQFSPHVVEAIVVNCGGDSSALTAIIERLTPASLPVYAVDLPGAAFNKCLAMNLGAFAASGSALLFLDADIVPLDDIVTPGLKLMEDSFITNVEAWETQSRTPTEWQAIFQGHLKQMRSKYQIEFVWSTGEMTSVEAIQMTEPGTGRLISGVVMIAKEHFLRAGGWDSRFSTWGFEDIDLHIRLKHALGLKLIKMGTARHLSHGNDKRALAGNTPAANNQANLLAACERYTKGEFSGTYDEDIGNWGGKAARASWPSKSAAHGGLRSAAS